MSDDPTVPLTQPTIETVLERINALAERLSGEIAQVRSDLNTELQSFREEVIERFAQVNDKLEVMTEEWLEMRSEQKRQRKRMDALERKIS